MAERPDIDAIRTRVEAASPAPWMVATGRGKKAVIGHRPTDGRPPYAIAVFAAIPLTQAARDATFAGHARQDIPALLAWIDHLETLTGGTGDD